MEMEIETAEYFDNLINAISRGEEVSIGVDYAIRNYADTCERGYEYYNVSQIHYVVRKNKMQDFVSTLKSAGIKTFTFTCNEKEANVLEALNLLCDCGCRIECVCKIKHIEYGSRYGCREYCEPAVKFIVD